MTAAKDKEETAQVDRGVTGEPPVTGAEGGVIQEGTGSFAPEAANPGGIPEDYPIDTVTVTDRNGTEVTVEAGYDSSAPVSPQNPPAKALLGGGRSADNQPPDSESKSAKKSSSAKS